MSNLSVIVCTHNPREDYFRRSLDALRAQTLSKDRWELLVVDNASDEKLAAKWDLSWHPRGRHVREENLGLTHARIRACAEAAGDLLVFVDDDNVLSEAYLTEAVAIHDRYPHLVVFGAGTLEPEFDVAPPAETARYLPLLALRTVSAPRWSNNPRDWESIPWGAGLCVTNSAAARYRPFVESLTVTQVLGRRGAELFCGEDNVFSWVAASMDCGFGIFPQLRVIHLISERRLTKEYVLRLIQDHATTHGVLGHLLGGKEPARADWITWVRLLAHGIRHGRFSMRCRWASVHGEDRAARLIAEKRLQPLTFPRTRNTAEQEPR